MTDRPQTLNLTTLATNAPMPAGQPIWRVLQWLLVGVICFSIAGCGATDTLIYRDRKPVLDMREFFSGRLTAHGVVSIWGEQKRHFKVVIDGDWQGNQGTLHEEFLYSDGETEQRTWQVSFEDDHHFTATAEDVIGEAEGTQHGNALNMQYKLDLERDSGEIVRLYFDDWMYRVDENVVLNKATISKFGIEIGEVLISFHKHPPEEYPATPSTADQGETHGNQG